jgi:vancomycin permeability regulator SanA
MMMRAIEFGVKKRLKRKRILRMLIILLVIGVLWVLYALSQIGSVMGDGAKQFSNTGKKDVGIVLGASLWEDEPSPGLKERLDKALADYKAGKFTFFLVTGGYDTPHSKYTEAEGMANYLEKQGISRDIIILENKATSTYENLKFSQALMMEKKLQSSLIITHDYHGNRAYEMAKSLNYTSPSLSIVKSEVLNSWYHTSREILSYTKWKLQQVGLLVGII